MLELELELEEDLARLGGFQRRLGYANSVRGGGLASALAPAALARSRPPRAMASAVVVGEFDEDLRKQVLLAFFVPAVVCMAGASGTQIETVVIRGISLDCGGRRLTRDRLLGRSVASLLVT